VPWHNILVVRISLVSTAGTTAWTTTVSVTGAVVAVTSPLRAGYKGYNVTPPLRIT
jgi:hypothetical protein